MSKRIYVGNLPWSVTKAKLEELFSSFGEMEDAIVMANKYTGRSRGFGFVTFKKEEDAEKAIKEMDKKEVEGRRLVVREAFPLRESGQISEGSRKEVKEPGPKENKKEEIPNEERSNKKGSEEKKKSKKSE